MRRSGDGLLVVGERPALYKRMSGLTTEHTEVVPRVVPGHVASKGVAVISSMADSHTVAAHDWSAPDTGCRGMSVTSACLTVQGCERQSRPSQSITELYEMVGKQVYVNRVEWRP